MQGVTKILPQICREAFDNAIVSGINVRAIKQGRERVCTKPDLRPERHHILQSLSRLFPRLFFHLLKAFF